jgi:hypothetical protein
VIGPRYWHTRAVVVLQVLSTLAITALEPGSLSHRLIETGGWLWVALLAAVGMAAAVDIVVNDLMPDRWVLPTVASYRYLVYMALAAGLWAVGGIMGSAAGGGWIMAHYMPLGCWAVLIAWTDLRHKHRRPAAGIDTAGLGELAR